MGNSVDSFVTAAYDGTLTPEGLVTAVVTNRIPVNGQHKDDGTTALHCAVLKKRYELVAALLAAGADPNRVATTYGTTVGWAAAHSTADILQLLIEFGGRVNNEGDVLGALVGKTSLFAVVDSTEGDVAARLGVLLARPELDLDAMHLGMTAEEWAVAKGRADLATAIAAEVRFSCHHLPSLSRVCVLPHVPPTALSSCGPG